MQRYEEYPTSATHDQQKTHTNNTKIDIVDIDAPTSTTSIRRLWKRGNAGLEGEETKERELEMYRDTQNMEFHFDIAFDGQIYYNELATSYHLVQRTVDVFVESSMGEISLGVWVRYLDLCG